MALTEKEVQVWEENHPGMTHPSKDPEFYTRGAPEVSDGQEQEQAAPELKFENDTAEFFGLPDEGGFVEEEDETKSPDDEIPDEYRQKTKAELAAELEKTRQEADLGSQLRDGIAGLRDSFRTQDQVPAPAADQPKVPSLEELGITNDTIFENSVENVSKLAEYKIRPYVEELAKRDLAKDRRLLTIDPATSSYAKRHIKEIDAIVESMPPNERFAGNAYDVAFQRHQAGNQDEVLGDRLESMLAEKPDSLIAALERQGYHISKNGGAAAAQSHSETGTGAPPAAAGGGKKRYRMSTGEAIEAQNRGMSLVQYVSTSKGIPLEKLEIANEKEIREWQNRRNRVLSQ